MNLKNSFRGLIRFIIYLTYASITVLAYGSVIGLLFGSGDWTNKEFAFLLLIVGIFWGLHLGLKPIVNKMIDEEDL